MDLGVPLVRDEVVDHLPAGGFWSADGALQATEHPEKGILIMS